jgi:hypothetical protein
MRSRQHRWLMLVVHAAVAAMIVTAIVSRTIVEAVVAMSIVAMVLVVFERVERAAHVVANELLVGSAGIRGGGVDQIAAAIGEPAIDAIERSEDMGYRPEESVCGRAQ